MFREGAAWQECVKILKEHMEIAEERIRQLERLVHYPNAAAKDIAMKECAAQIQAKRDPLSDFARRLLNPSDLGYAVTFEVRNAARRALGLPEVKEYDL